MIPRPPGPRRQRVRPCIALEVTASALRTALLERSAVPPDALARLAQQLAEVTQDLHAWHQHLLACPCQATAHTEA